MLVDTRDHRPEPPRRRRTPDIDWRLWMWTVESLGLFVLASSLGGAVAAVCVVMGLITMVKAFDALTGGYRRGLREWRQ